MMSVLDFVNDATTSSDFGTTDATSMYRLYIAIIHEEDGSFSSIVLNLPGAGSCGDTEEKAIANAKEAATGVIHTYLEENKEIPWCNDFNDQIPEGATIKRELLQLNV